MENSKSINHRLAPRMCLIAAMSYNVTLASTFGTFSIFLEAVEQQLKVTREISSLGLAFVMVGIAGTSPFVGGLTSKISLRVLMIVGLIMQASAYMLLCVSRNIVISLVVYLVLIGPGLCLTATVLPATLVMRWYRINRGRALGLVFISVGLTIMPLAASYSLNKVGLSMTYLALALLLLCTVVPALFVRDWPPDISETLTGTDTEHRKVGEMAVGGVLKRKDFWSLTLAYASITMISTILTSFLVSMVKPWGIDGIRAASLLSILAFAGMAGTVVFGAIADRMGAARALTLLCLNTAILWVLMLTAPRYILLVPLVGLMGFHAAAASGVFAASISDHFGDLDFTRAFGLGNMISLPFGVLAIPLAAWVFVRTGSYASALLGMIIFLLLAASAAFMTRRRGIALMHDT